MEDSSVNEMIFSDKVLKYRHGFPLVHAVPVSNKRKCTGRRGHTNGFGSTIAITRLLVHLHGYIPSSYDA